MQDTLHTGPDVREKLIAGVRKASGAVGSTMGIGGSNVIIEAIERPGHLTTNDGATALESIYFADPIEQMGRNILLEAVSRANKGSGDGSSTTCVATAAILEEGQHDTGNPMELKRSLEECIPLIEEAIDAQTKQITVDEVGAVAAISAEDPKIGATIQEIYQQIGKEGIVHWDISKTSEDSYTVGTGLTVEGATYYSPYMCDADETGQNTNRIKLKNAKVLIVKQKITSAGEFNELFATMFNKDIRDVVVFCDEIEPLIINDIILTRAKKGFRAILVKMPILWKDQWFEDLALASGATIIDAVAGLPIKDAKMDHLGSFEHITITKDQTFVDGIQSLTAHVEALKEDGSDEALVRAARLNTKTARYFVGAHSDSALSYRRLKVEDAIAAAYHALNGGIVIGGGIALAGIKTGNRILDKALKAPHEQIVKNMGSSFSAKDMQEQNVYDPATVVKNAAKNAISVAATILTVKSIITLPRQEQEMARPDVVV